MERTEIIKALEHCINDATCEQCNYSPSTCFIEEDALSLIKELTAKVAEWEEECDLRGDMWCKLNEENKRLTKENKRLELQIECKERILESYMLQYGTVVDKEFWLKKERADTVRKMQSEIEARCIKGGIYPAFVKRTIDQIADEIIGETNDHS